jgi:putative ribosome biogenesis GTPase RsgA
MNGNAILDLITWKKDEIRKPLILGGASQVGKTTLVNQFSKESKITKNLLNFF